MKITLRKLKEAEGALTKILSLPINVKLSYRMRKIAAKILAEFKTMEEMRVEIVKKLGEENKDGRFEIKKEKFEAFQKAYEEMLNIEVNIDIQKIPFDCLDSDSSWKCPHCQKEIDTKIKISAIDMALLDGFIADPEEGKEINKPDKKKK